MNYYSAGDSWRISFALLPLAEQRQRVRELRSRGWSPESLARLCGWPLERVNAAIREKTTSNTTTTGEQT